MIRSALANQQQVDTRVLEMEELLDNFSPAVQGLLVE